MRQDYPIKKGVKPKLPNHHEPYTDVYFVRSKKILQAENLNPFVRTQIFIRQGPGKIYGIDEAFTIIDAYSDLVKNGGKVFALKNNDIYNPSETVMALEGRIQDIITLETILLGVLSAETTKGNDHIDINLKDVTHRVKQIVKTVDRRPILYFGARHWRFDQDAAISKAAFTGGAYGASTDIGAASVGQKGIGTIPHSLQCIFAWKYGHDKAVIKSIEAFDRWINPSIPRIALVDFANKEIDDALECAFALGDRLYGVRVDTCGENTMQGVRANSSDLQYWSGTGVSICGVYALRHALNKAGFRNIKIVLSSGFAQLNRIRSFVRAEKKLGLQLFDTLGVGEVFPVRGATMDIVGVGEDLEHLKPMAKVGRKYKPNKRMKQVR